VEREEGTGTGGVFLRGSGEDDCVGQGGEYGGDVGCGDEADEGGVCLGTEARDEILWRELREGLGSA
jgi:hypothetical protein